jgi:hypothetical protein
MTQATFEVKIGKEVYEVDAKDEAEAWKLANTFHAQTPPPPPPEKSTGESIMSAVKDFPRQVGLTGRYAIEGAANTLGLPLEPLRMGVSGISQLAGGPPAASISTYGTKLADLLGLPKPRESSVMDTQTGLAKILPSEQIVGDVATSIASTIPMVSGAAALAKNTTGITSNVANQLAANPMLQYGSAAGAGYGSGLTREAGGDPLQQFFAGLAGGIAAPAAYGGAKSLLTSAGQKVAPTLTGKLNPDAVIPSPAEVDQIITLKLGQSGIDYSKMSDQVKKALNADVTNALRTGGDLGGDAMRRLLDFRMIEGTTPTKGMITLDPRQVTLEQNLAKTGMNSQDPNLQTLGNVQASNNRALIEALNAQGAGNVQTPYLREAGKASTAKIVAEDVQKQADTSKLYDEAKALPGGELPLNRFELVKNIDAALARENKNAFLPESVRGMINSIAKGEVTIEGVKYPVPFDVKALDNLLTTVATAQRATSDGNIIGALKLVRNAIDQTEIKPVKAEFGGGQVVTESGASFLKGQDATPKELLDALNKARASHRERMQWQESNRPVEQTVNGMQPDQFVRDFVISKEATVADAAAVAKSGDPTATKSAILTHLKDLALGGKPDELGTFGASTYNKALKNIGDDKLALFFSPEEIGELQRLGRVAQYMTLQPKGSAVNNSNSGALVLGAGIDVLANSVGVGFPGIATLAVPFAKKQLQGTLNAAEQRKSLDMGKALSQYTPGFSLGERVVPASIYAGFLTNPQVGQQ